MALPLLDAMTPAFAQSSTPRTLRFGTIYVPHGVIMDVWMPKKTGTDFELPIILKPLAGLREHFNVVTGLYSEGANAHSACPGFFSASAHAPRGNLDRAQHVDRPGHRAEDRPRHDVPVDGARDRGQLEHLRHLRRRLPLHLHGHDLVAHADAAVADGAEPARRVRAHVRRRRHERRSAPRAARAERPASWTPSPRTCTACPASWPAATARASTSISRTCARSSAASCRPRTNAPSAGSKRRRRRAAFPSRSRST